jgi:hypothetical protein
MSVLMMMALRISSEKTSIRRTIRGPVVLSDERTTTATTLDLTARPHENQSV